MKLNAAQQELIDRTHGDIVVEDIPKEWWSAADLDEKMFNNRQAREAKSAEPARQAPTPKLYVTEESLRETLEEIGRATAAYIAPLTDLIHSMGKRIAELEARPLGLDYRGVFEPGAAYGKNMGVSHAGSVWVALNDHPGKPGVDNSWQLACKRGRDGKDGKDASK